MEQLGVFILKIQQFYLDFQSINIVLLLLKTLQEDDYKNTNKYTLHKLKILNIVFLDV